MLADEKQKSNVVIFSQTIIDTKKLAQVYDKYWNKFEKFNFLVVTSLIYINLTNSLNMLFKSKK